MARLFLDRSMPPRASDERRLLSLTIAVLLLASFVQLVSPV
jgi:hypothetical protein